MKNLKIFLWVLLLFIIQTVTANYIRINGIVPDIVFAFIAALTMLEGDYVCAVTVSVICGVFSGSLGGGSFAFETLYYTYSAVLILKFRDKYKNVPRIFKTAVTAFVLNTVFAVIRYFIKNLSLPASAVLHVFLPYGFYNTLIAAVIYVLVKYTMYGGEGKREKQLIQKNS